jgi:hypothetical protein
MGNKRKRELEFADLPPEIGLYILEYATVLSPGKYTLRRIYNKTPKFVCRTWYDLYHEIMKKRIGDLRKNKVACMNEFIKKFHNHWRMFFSDDSNLALEVEIDETRLIRIVLIIRSLRRYFINYTGVSQNDIFPGLKVSFSDASDCGSAEVIKRMFQIKAQRFRIILGEENNMTTQRLHRWLDLPKGECTKTFTPEQLEEFVILKRVQSITFRMQSHDETDAQMASLT